LKIMMMTPRRIAIYDFDGTLYNGETMRDFYIFCANRNPLLYLLLPYFGALYLLLKCKAISPRAFKERGLVFLGRKINMRMVEKFWRKKNKRIFPWVKRELERDRKEKYTRLCISASPDTLIRHTVVNRLGFNSLIATRLDIIDNRKLDGEPCKGEEKVRRFRRWLAENRVKGYEIVKMVSDSSADMPLYALAKERFKVTPKGELLPGEADVYK
jgi:HAD superfamily phosphoserine phosphatase-like hydrolase